MPVVSVEQMTEGHRSERVVGENELCKKRDFISLTEIDFFGFT